MWCALNNTFQRSNPVAGGIEGNCVWLNAIVDLTRTNASNRI
jgi:hypothetical protein